jgi:hypothetical protein
MKRSRHLNHHTAVRYATLLLAVVAIAGACRPAIPVVRFAPSGTDVARLRTEFALTDAERLALKPENMRAFSQDQVDQIYLRLASGPIPDGPFRGDLFFLATATATRVRDLTDAPASLPAHLAALDAERLGRAFWKGKVFFRAQGILRNRIEDLSLLKPFITGDVATIPKLTFDGQTTWLLFPARLSCGVSRRDPSRPSIVIDYSKGKEIEGYREVPDKLGGPEGLNIFDEVRRVRPGFYLGRAYFGARFALNFTLLDPQTGASPAGAGAPSPDLLEDCKS